MAGTVFTWPAARPVPANKYARTMIRIVRVISVHSDLAKRYSQHSRFTRIKSRIVGGVGSVPVPNWNDHTTIWRWVQRYAPERNKRCRRKLKPTNGSWRVDQTYICQAGSLAVPVSCRRFHRRQLASQFLVSPYGSKYPAGSGRRPNLRPSPCTKAVLTISAPNRRRAG